MNCEVKGLTHDGQNGHQSDVKLAAELTLGDMVNLKDCLFTSAFGVGVVDDAIIFMVFGIHSDYMFVDQHLNWWRLFVDY